MKKVVINNKEFIVASADAPYKPNFWIRAETGQWEKETFAAFDRYLDHEHSFIDIGSWIGPTVLYGCQIAKHCYAIEPDPVAFRILKQNIDLNPGLTEKITLFNGCLGDKCGKVDFGTNSNYGDAMSSLLFGQKHSIKVESLTFSEFIKIHQIGDCNFIKIDIEGGEMIVLQDMKEYLVKYLPTLYLSLHPYFAENSEDYSNVIIGTLKIYPHVFLSNGVEFKPDDLIPILKSLPRGNLSVIGSR